MSDSQHLYTIGKWKIFARPESEDGSVLFSIQTEGSNYPSHYVSGYIRDSWFKRSIRTAWDMALKYANKRHQLDNESEAAMDMVKDMVDNHLSPVEVENLLKSVLP